MTKQQLRNIYKAKRQPMSVAGMHEQIAAMLENFQQIPFPRLYYMLSFKSSTARLEVPVHFFEEGLREDNRDMMVCYPRADFEQLSMDAYEDNDNLRWEETAFGLEQPRSGDKVQPLQLDLVLVPLLCFDTRGYRVGYGKGFYDRYLPLCRPNLVKVGVSFFEAEPIITDTNQYDVPLTYCVTPKQLYVF